MTGAPAASWLPPTSRHADDEAEVKRSVPLASRPMVQPWSTWVGSHGAKVAPGALNALGPATRHWLTVVSSRAPVPAEVGEGTQLQASPPPEASGSARTARPDWSARPRPEPKAP